MGDEHHSNRPADPSGTELALDGGLLEDVRWLEQLARRLARDPFLAADACQNVWLSWSRATEAGAEGRATEPVDRNALARALRRALWVLRRSDARRRRREEERPPPDPSPSTAELLARGEERERAWRTLVELDEPLRAVLLLRFEEGLTPAEIAARLQLRPDTVRWRLRRGIELLRERLGHRVEPPPSAFGLGWLLLPFTSLFGRRASAAAPPSASPSVLAPASTLVSALLMSKSAVLSIAGALVALALVVLLRSDDAGERIPASTDGPEVAVETELTDPGAAPSLAAPRAAVAARAEAEPSAATVAAAAPHSIVVGRTVEQDGLGGWRPLAGASIVAALGEEWSVESTSDAEGRFRLETPFPDVAEVRLEFVATEFHQRRELLAGGVEPGARPPLVAAHQGESDLGDVPLLPACVLESRCLGSDGTAFEGAVLRIEGHWTREPSDRGGYWRLAHVPVGVREIVVRERGFIEIVRREELVAGRVNRLAAFVLEFAPLVSGVVTDMDGVPLQGASVSTRGYTRGFTFECDENGRFEAIVTELEGVELSARGKGHFQRDGVRVVPGETDVRIALESLGDLCAVRVVAADTGEPLAEVALRVLRPEYGWIPERAADLERDPPAPRATQDGVHRFTARPGRDRLDVSAPGFRRIIAPIEPLAVVTGEEAAPGQVVALERLGGLSGRMVTRDPDTGATVGVEGVAVELVLGELAVFNDAEGSGTGAWRTDPLAAVLKRQEGYSLPEVRALDRPLPPISVDPLFTDVLTRATTDADGRFVFEAAVEDVMFVLAHDPSSGRVARSELLAADPGVASDFGDVELVAPASIRGQLRFGASDDHAGHLVIGGARRHIAARTDASGGFLLEGLTPGDHLLELRLADGRLIVSSSFNDQVYLHLRAGEQRAVVIDIATEVSATVDLRATLNGEAIVGGWVLADGNGAFGGSSVDLDGDGRGELIAPADRELWFITDVDGTWFMADERRTFAPGRTTATVAFETFHLEVELEQDVERDRESVPTLSFVMGERSRVREGVLLREGTLGPVYRFEHLPLTARELVVAPQGGGSGDWSLALDERLAELERFAGAVLQL
ncbi:RNA polymerase sigma factor [Planctomycetes bacterium Pla163]|uniref:RNA polymerase sigma factor n=1 Tax=Rohdeia mirabilis TaxID=2528008 RepID=A0A518D4X9_9BACT|nr:RNA polymerase sigma factor [Planctomycetes bacterium Pla163]